MSNDWWQHWWDEIARSGGLIAVRRNSSAHTLTLGRINHHGDFVLSEVHFSHQAKWASEDGVL